MGDHPGAHDKSSRTTQKRLPGEAEVNLRRSTLQETLQGNLDTDGVEEASLNCNFRESNDIYDGEISLGTKPGVPAEYEFVCVHEAQLQAKDASLQEVLKEVAKLKSCNKKLEAEITETQKRCDNAEEKARKKSQDLSTAKMEIIDNNTQINNLERQISELEMTLGETMENLEKKHEELVLSEAKYARGLKKATKFWHIYSELGDDLFYQMTYLEVIVANELGRIFFEGQDLELKNRAAKYLPLGEACKTMQADLAKFSWAEDANDDLPVDEVTAGSGFQLAIKAPPAIGETGESSSFVTPEIEPSSHSTSPGTRTVEDRGYLESTTPEVSIPELNAFSESEASLLSLSALFNSEEGCPDSATSNDPEPESSLCEESGADSFYGPEVEGSSTAETRGLRWLLGYNPSPEEYFYPQYLQGGSMVDSTQERVIHEVLSPRTEAPGLEWLLGFNAHPEEPFYPQLPQHDNEEKDNDSTNSTESAENDNLTALMGYNLSSERPVGFREPQSSSGAKEPAMGLDLAWLLGYNPEPEEAFYPQYSQHHKHGRDSTSAASVEQVQEPLSAMTPGIAPTFEVYPENHATATALADFEPLAVDISFADTSKDFKEEVLVQAEREDTAATASTELEQQEASSKTYETAPVFTTQVEDPAPAATTPAPQGHSVDITFGDTSQPFKAGTKVRMTRAQRREAATKAQAEAKASKKKTDGPVMDDEGRYGGKQSRQERRAAERKASKAGSKQSNRNIWRL